MNLIRSVGLIVLLASLLGGVAAESFGNSQNEPVPNVTDIEVYDVTSETTEQGNEIRGTLVDSGLNSTLKVSQENERQYRFSFEIVNDGNSNWNIDSADVMNHSGLNNSWTVDKIWYNITGDQDYNGGTFSSGTVDWTLDSNSLLGTTDTMYAKYLVSVTDPDSTNYSEEFIINDTSNNAGSFDNHKFFVEKLGYLNLNLTEPPNDSIVVQNQSFLMNGSVECLDGKCGAVTIDARYNESSTADTDIPNSATAEPFNTNISSRTCSLGRGEKCFTNFSVNASGSFESYHLLDYEASSSRDIENNDSDDHLVQINAAQVIDLNWTTIDFGTLSPGETNKSAKNNSNHLYNITVDERSETVDDIWIKATDLNSTRLNYNISAKNLSFSTTNDISTETFFSNTYKQLTSNSLSPGDVLTTFYWIDVPFGIYKGNYNGTIFFKTNSTG